MADDNNQSIDVITIDKDGLNDIMYYDFRNKEWVSLTDFRDESTKWMWYYSPVTKFDIK